MPYGTALKEPMCVLHIDDDPALSALVKRALTRRGHSVIHVTTGDEAVNRLAEKDIDIIALDHTLATETGLDILARIGTRASRPPIVYVTGSLDCAPRHRALKQGADDYVVKDTSEDFFHLLIAALEQALERGASSGRPSATRSSSAPPATGRRCCCARSITALPTR